MSVFIICEVGVNHNGDVGQAYLLANAAKEAGADAVKFQHFNSKRLWGDSRIENLELTNAEMESVAWHCQKIGIEFMCTPFGIEEVAFLKPLIKQWKVSSGCLRRKKLLNAIRDTNLPVILSTGMSTVKEVDDALNELGFNLPCWFGHQWGLLHCTSAYPCPIKDVNLASMDVLRHHFGRCKIGYSDHTLGITIPIAAVGRGAEIIEKHLTLNRNQDGPDHKASLEPAEFRTMVSAIRTVEEAIGDFTKKPRESELELRKIWNG